MVNCKKKKGPTDIINENVVVLQKKKKNEKKKWKFNSKY
jgi:hypothetical protein